MLEPEQATVRRREQRRRTVSVLLLSVALLVSGIVPSTALLSAGPAVDAVSLPWWAVAVMFAAAELVVMNVQFRREASAISLSELPLVLALFFSPPLELVSGRVLAVVLVLVLHRRSPLLKCLFNSALTFAGTALAVAAFRLLLGDGDVHGPRTWAAALAAVALEQVLAIAAISRVIAVYEEAPPASQLLREVREQLLLSSMIVVIALVAVASLVQDVRNGVLLLGAAAVVLVAYRAYTTLFDRHLSLERMYGFSQVVSSTPEVDEVLRSVLREAQQLLRAERVEVVVLPGHASTSPVRVALSDEGNLVRSEVADAAEDRWVYDRVVGERKGLLLPRTSRELGARHHLDRRGWSEAILVPLRGGSGVFGTLTVADRMGEVRAFDGQDVVLLETVANHASVALQNGRLIDELRHEALHDALTGLPNRVLLRQVLDAALEGVRLRRDCRTAVMVIDLDGFKDVNDTFGHAQGDALLQEVGERLRSAVGHSGTVARLGGDEFAVVLPDCGDDEAALRVARRVMHSFRQPMELDDQVVEVGASVGVALAPAHGTDTTSLLKRADLAMYNAKQSTGGLRVFEPVLDTSTERRLTLVAELRHALSARELEVHVQPQADLATREVRSVEALVRWHHPRLGQVSPEEFIAVAERSGLIGALTTLVLEQSLAACAAWRADGIDVSVAVNLSTRSLLDTDLLDEVRRLLRRYELPARSLTLEVTESGVMADPARAVALLLELRELGVRLSVDDFGTGYSSLSYLKRLPVHEVKIDKSFVLDLTTHGEDGAIVRSIVDLGGNLGLDVVAEGVEDEPTWQLLQSMGCRLGQGWHLARPMPPSELPGWLRNHRARSSEERQRADRLRIVG